MPAFFDASDLAALFSVVVIDLALAGDNAIVVGVAAAGLPARERRRVILAGIALATLLRIALATVALELLAIIGLTLAGGILLLWVAWKLYRELIVAGGDAAAAHARPPKSFARALTQVVAADVSMSLDNVLAIAGAARQSIAVLAVGLVLSVALMGAASSLVARLLARYRWIAWLGLAIVTFVALRMIHEGMAEVIAHVGPRA